MNLNAFFEKNPLRQLAILLFWVACWAATLLAYRLMGEPIFLLLINILLGIKWWFAYMRFTEILNRNSKRYLVLDKDDKLVVWNSIAREPWIRKVNPRYAQWNDFHKEHFSVKIVKRWYGFQVELIGPDTEMYRVSYLGYRRWYGYGVKLYHRRFAESIVMRDFCSTNDLFAHLLRALDGSAALGVHQLVWRAHTFTKKEQIQRYDWRNKKKPKLVKTGKASN